MQTNYDTGLRNKVQINTYIFVFKNETLSLVCYFSQTILNMNHRFICCYFRSSKLSISQETKYYLCINGALKKKKICAEAYSDRLVR